MEDMEAVAMEEEEVAGDLEETDVTRPATRAESVATLRATASMDVDPGTARIATIADEATEVVAVLSLNLHHPEDDTVAAEAEAHRYSDHQRPN